MRRFIAALSHPKYAVEALCWSIGTTFFLPTGFPTVEYLDRFLKDRSSPVLLERLVFSGFPLPIPQPGAFPLGGSWSPEDVIVGAKFFGGLRVEEEGELIQVGVEQIRRWLVEAIKRETDALAGFSS